MKRRTRDQIWREKDRAAKIALMEELHERGYEASISTGGIRVRRLCMATAAPFGGCGYQVDWKANYEFPDSELDADVVDHHFKMFREKLESIFSEMDISVFVGQVKS